MATFAWQRAEQLHQRAAIGQNEVLEARGKVDLAIATLEGMNDDYAEESDQLKLEIRRKKAELDQAIAQKKAALALVARNVRVNDRKAGMIAEEDVAKAESELGAAESHIQVKQVELEESELRHRQIVRRRERIGQILESARRAASTAAPSDQPVKPAAPPSK